MIGNGYENYMPKINSYCISADKENQFVVGKRIERMAQFPQSSGCPKAVNYIV